MAEIDKEAVGFPVICHIEAGEFTLSASIIFFFNVFTLFTRIKKNVQS